MPTQTYNTGRVVGWSAYEEFLKENPDVDPDIVTAQIYYRAVTYGVSRVVDLPTSGWTGTTVLKQTVALPGALWGVVPILGIYYEGVQALQDTETAASNKAKVEGAFSNVFSCFVSNASGTRVSNSTSTAGYLTFLAHPSIRQTGLDKIPLLVRGLGVEALLDGKGYLGPQGLIFNGGKADVSTEAFSYGNTDTPEKKGYYLVLHDATADRYALSMADGETNSKYLLDGGSGDIDVELEAGSSNSSGTSYSGKLTWNQLVAMLVENKAANIHMNVAAVDPNSDTVADVTRCFYETRNVPVCFEMGWSPPDDDWDNDRYQKYLALYPYPGSGSLDSAPGDGYYRVFLKLYKSNFSTVAKFELIVGAYVKYDYTVHNPAPGSDRFRATGLFWRGGLHDKAVARLEANGQRGVTSLFGGNNADISGNFQESVPISYKWETVPDGEGGGENISSFFTGKSYKTTRSSWGFGVSVEILGHAMVGPNNDIVYLVDRSYGYGDGGSYLDVWLGGYAKEEQCTFHKASSLEFDHWTFDHRCEGTYIQ